jgi:cell division protein FtsQ
VNGPAQAARIDGYGLNVGRYIGSLLLLAAFAGVLWVWLGVVKSDRWPIRWLEVDGAFERVSAEQVRKAAAPLVDGSFFTVDPKSIREAVRGLPWVHQVAVQKTWPDTVRLHVTEYVPVAHWTEGRLIATNGDAFTVPGAEGIQGLPWLEGPEGSVREVIEGWLAYTDILQGTGQEIRRIRLDARGAWTLELAGGTRVEVGREAPAERLRRMAASWSQLRRLKDVLPAGVDLRYSNGFAVRWPDVPEAPAEVLGERETGVPAPALADNR